VVVFLSVLAIHGSHVVVFLSVLAIHGSHVVVFLSVFVTLLCEVQHNDDCICNLVM
jgi:hypothetical protein